MKWNSAKSGRLIRKAADIMNNRGHAKGRFQDSTGALCIRGAVNYAWCGNVNITMNYEYSDKVGLHCVFPSFDQLKAREKSKRNPQVVQALTEFRNYLRENKLIELGANGVESFNDKNEKDEVVRWMRKFADEVDPQK